MRLDSRRYTLLPGESRENEVLLSGRQKLRIEIYYSILDKLKIEFESRCSRYKPICKRFNFLMNICDESVSVENLTQEEKDFQKFYAEDSDETFPVECLHFKNYIGSACNKNEKNRLSGSAINLLSFLRDSNLQVVFPNVSITLQVFLCMVITNCSPECAFSYLKRIKNYLQSTISECRLDDLALLCIEYDLMEGLNTEQIVDEFAGLKCRREL